MALIDRTLDTIELRLLGMLQDYARVSQADMARTVGLAPSAVLERLRKLEARGVIRGFAAVLDPRAVDLGQLAFVAVRVSGSGEQEENAGARLAAVPEVLEVHHVAGEDCYLLKVRTRDAQHLGALLRQRLGRIPGVVSTRTTVVLETVKETSRLPLETRTDLKAVQGHEAVADVEVTP
ncbi:Leucine-responsive regulatory protein [Luteitalea pratensis]|uniref:Leucine-responsive regulatory protein n=1 Tax=Luteitalea pratensis TaxID=1855912 RepID=A0A143PWI3_LUTPR|nr:Lrp/AsnC family transcriptional regulator [Luteitalea pratensis]AMY12932.1 Leucine-responsive regulatory protein [Luteitalea pratensis]